MHTSSKMTRWWFQIFFYFHPYLGKNNQFDDHFFQRGWFNHQLVMDMFQGLFYKNGPLHTSNKWSEITPIGMVVSSGRNSFSFVFVQDDVSFHLRMIFRHHVLFCSYTVRFIGRIYQQYTTLICKMSKHIPSRKLTYPPKMAFWRWFSFSPGGIC